MSTLKVNKIRDTSGSADAITLDPSGGAVLAGVTTISTARITTGITTSIQVGGGVTISESGIEASGIGITVANINGGQISGRRNIVINGSMQVAQRGTSSTTTGYQTVDRWNNSYAADASATFTQHALTSSDSGPYEEGHRYSNHVVNGDTDAGSTQKMNFQQPIEAQNVSLSGWNYTSPSSFITLSFWAKSSVGQTFNMSVMATDGTIKNFPFDVTLAANTWTKVIKTIPGNSGLTIANDNGEGFRININVFTGTTYTSNSVTNDTWQDWASGTRFRDNTSTWFTTDGATFEYTGVQLEVGTQATSFEHRSFGEELALCQRYFYRYRTYHTYGQFFSWISYGNTDQRAQNIFFPVPMRATPSLSYNTDMTQYENLGLGGAISQFQLADGGTNRESTGIRVTTADTIQSGLGGRVRATANTDGYFDFNGEL